MRNDHEDLQLADGRVPGLRPAWALLAGSVVFALGCGGLDLGYSTGRSGPWRDAYCGGERRATLREDGVWTCPSGAAYAGSSVGWVDAKGVYEASGEVHPTGGWVNLCPTMALVSYGGGTRPWQIFWGSRANGWTSRAQVETSTGYLACKSQRFYYVVGSTCYVLERGRKPRVMECDPKIFHGRGSSWDVVDD